MDPRREKMLPMSVDSSADVDIEGVRSMTVFPPLTSNFYKEMLYESPMGRAMILVVLGLILFVLVSMPSTREELIEAGLDPDDARQMYFRPNNLYSLLQTQMKSARENSALSSLSISTPHYIVDESIEFLVFVAQKAESSLKGKSATLIDPVSTSSSSSSNNANVAVPADPFDKQNIDSRLVVTPIAPLHTLVLNKFNTVDGHALLVTDEFHEQSSPLTYQDLEAWYWCIDQIGAVGFYNSALIAGASQRHKHMQLVPLATVAGLRDQSPPSSSTIRREYALPVDDVIMPKILSGEWRPYTPHGEQRYGLPPSPSQYTSATSPYGTYFTPSAEEQVKAAAARTAVISPQFYTLPQFHFRHSLAVLLDPGAWRELNQRIDPAYRLPSYSVYLELLYQDLLTSAGLHQSPCTAAPTASDSRGSGSGSGTGSRSGSGGGSGSGSGSGQWGGEDGDQVPLLTEVLDVVNAVARRLLPATATASATGRAGTGTGTGTGTGAADSDAGSPQTGARVDATAPGVTSTQTAYAGERVLAAEGGYCQAYNLLLTAQWMLVVPRYARDFEGLVGVNGFGFVGMLLAREEAGVEAIEQSGPLNILRSVTFAA